MIKRLAALLLILALPFGLGGCWDYRSLDELTIVSGIAIDRNPDDPALYDLAFEVIDTLTPSEKGQVGSRLIKTTGRSVLEAIDNANTQLFTEMYFGNTELVLLGEQIAREGGLIRIVESFLREFSTRDNILVAVARGNGSELITPEKDSNFIISYNINRSLEQGKQDIKSTRPMRMYQISDQLATKTSDLALPTLKKSDSEDKDTGPALDGIALFQDERLVDFLDVDETGAYLLLTEELTSGAYVFDVEHEGEVLTATLRIRTSTPDLRFRFADDALTLIASLHIDVSISDLPVPFYNPGQREIDELERAASESLNEDIRALIGATQSGPGVEIFGFFDAIYRADIALWNRLKGDRARWFRSAAIEVDCQVHIEDLGLIGRLERNK